MSSAIPTSTSISVSVVVNAPLSAVWHKIKLADFASWWSKLKKAEDVKGASNEVDVVRWTFNDGTVMEVKQEAHSTIEHYITYSAITSNPAITYTSVLSTIRCYEVTSGAQMGSTYVTWTAQFSSDADAGVIEDARFKREEALEDLAKAVSKK